MMLIVRLVGARGHSPLQCMGDKTGQGHCCFDFEHSIIITIVLARGTLFKKDSTLMLG